MRQMSHQYYDVSDLNARWDQIPLQGLGGGSIATGALGSLGGGQSGLGFAVIGIGPALVAGAAAAAADDEQLQKGLNVAGSPDAQLYPWGVASDVTRAHQVVINQKLRERGLCALTTDGKLGAKTCGAARATGQYVPTTCQSFTDPGRCPSGGATVVDTVTDIDEEMPTTRAGFDIPPWAWGVGIGLVGVGAAVLLRKKRRR